MTFNPKTLRDLGAFWVSKGGVNLGVVGNKAHTIGYHLGRDRIFDGAGPGIGVRDYSVQEARDKAGLSDAASAIDLGKLNGSLDELYAFSRWLVAECQAKKRGTRDIREIIYSPDGQNVQRYSGVDGQIHTGEGNGDASHLTHTHISYFRDSENRDKASVFAPYFVEEDVPGLAFTMDDPTPGRIKSKNIPGQAAIQLADRQVFVLPADWEGDTFGLGRCDENIGGSGSPLGYLIGDELAVIPAGQVDYTPDTLDCSAPVGAQRERDRIAVLAAVEEVYAS